MKTFFYITVLILGLLTFGGTEANAKKVEGYIITHENDTVRGLINLYKFSLSSGSVFLGDFNSEMLFTEVPFKAPEQKKYKIYNPEDIKGYGFVYKGLSYEFVSMLVKSNTYKIVDREKLHFLQRIRTDNKVIYKHQKYRLEPGTRELIPFYVFYLLGKDGQLIKINN